jgi:FKBP-type peptidyl-prolyl cis-trans isomerase FkpA
VRARGRIKVEELHPGAGAVATRQSTVTIRYSLYLNRGSQVQKDEQVTFVLGARRLIAGLEYGVEGMRVGGRRRIHVPPHLGYGSAGAPGVPPHAKLVLEVELLSTSAKTAG